MRQHTITDYRDGAASDDRDADKEDDDDNGHNDLAPLSPPGSFNARLGVVLRRVCASERAPASGGPD